MDDTLAALNVAFPLVADTIAPLPKVNVLVVVIPGPGPELPASTVVTFGLVIDTGLVVVIVDDSVGARRRSA